MTQLLSELWKKIKYGCQPSEFSIAIKSKNYDVSEKKFDEILSKGR